MYCDRNLCFQNDVNGIGCDECEVNQKLLIEGDAPDQAVCLAGNAHPKDLAECPLGNDVCDPDQCEEFVITYLC